MTRGAHRSSVVVKVGLHALTVAKVLGGGPVDYCDGKLAMIASGARGAVDRRSGAGQALVGASETGGVAAIIVVELSGALAQKGDPIQNSIAEAGVARGRI